MKLLFMGTPEFALPSLRYLIGHHEVCGVITQPDKPKGRGHKLTPSPVKEAAVAAGIPVYQPETLKGDAAMPILRELEPELIVVVAYGKILPPGVLEFPKYGCINVHASLLPRWRGAAPLQRCVMEGDAQTGVTTQQMGEGLDTGDILVQSAIPITEEDTGGSIHDKLSELGAQVLAQTLEQIDRLTPVPQTEEGATYASMITKETCRVDWSLGGRQIVNLIRGLFPVPLAYTTLGGKIVKLGAASFEPGGALRPGQIGAFRAGRGLAVGCGDGTVYLSEIKPEGKKMMKTEDFLRGNTIPDGARME